jgi:Tfp pilus assembly protein PilF
MKFNLIKINACLGAVVIGILCIETSSVWAIDDQEAKARSLASYTMGVINDLNGFTEDAIEQFQKSLEHEDNYAAHLRLGADYARLGDLTMAVNELKQVIALDEHNIQARYLLALIYSTQRDYDKAAQEYEAILKSFTKIQPENIEIYGYLAQLYYSQKDYRKAIEQFEAILTIDKRNVDVMFLLGCLYLELNERQKAIDVFSRAVKVNPEHDTSLNSLGYLYAEDGKNLEEAQQLVERAIKIDPQNAAYLDSLGWVFYKKGDFAAALRYLKEADSLMKDPVIAEHLGDVYFKMKNNSDAKKYWAQSLELLPNQKKVIEKLNSVQ